MPARLRLNLELWKETLEDLLPTDVYVGVVIAHAPERVALKAIKLYMEAVSLHGDSWEEPSEAWPAPWYLDDYQDLLIEATYRNFTHCVHFLLDPLSDEQLGALWKHDYYFYCRTLPHIAAEQGHSNVLEVLSYNDLLIDQEDDNQVTPLEIAVRKNHVNVARCLLETGDCGSVMKIPARKPDDRWVYPGEYVAICGTVPMMQAFLESECGLNFHHEFLPGKHKSLLKWSLLGKNFDMSMLLLNNRAKAKIANGWRKSMPLAIKVAPIRVIRRMIDAYGESNPREVQDEALEDAANDNSEIADLIMSVMNADPFVSLMDDPKIAEVCRELLSFHVWDEVLDIAVRRGDEEIIQLLVDSDPKASMADVEAARKREETRANTSNSNTAN